MVSSHLPITRREPEFIPQRKREREGGGIGGREGGRRERKREGR